MVPSDNFHDGLDIEPMTPEHFDIAVADIHFRRADISKACRAVLVDGKRTSDIVDKFDIPQPQLSRAVARIQEKWQQLCVHENLISRIVVLSPQAMAVVTELENQLIPSLKKQLPPKKSPSRPSYPTQRPTTH